MKVGSVCYFLPMVDLLAADVCSVGSFGRMSNGKSQATIIAKETLRSTGTICWLLKKIRVNIWIVLQNSRYVLTYKTWGHRYKAYDALKNINATGLGHVTKKPNDQNKSLKISCF